MGYYRKEMVEEARPTIYVVDSGDVMGRRWAVVALLPYGTIIRGHKTGLLENRLSGCSLENPGFLNNEHFCVPFDGPAKDSLSLAARVDDLIREIPHSKASIKNITEILEKNNIYRV